MATVANVVAKFEADTTDLQAGAKRVTSSMQGMQSDVARTAKGMSGLKVAVGAALGAAAVAGITSAARAFTQFATASIDAARESQVTVRRMEQIATSMGILDTVLGGTTARLEQYADTLMRQTGTDDEVIKSAQAVILTFQDVASSAGETGGIFDRATAAALDLAAAGFGSVEGNARSLSRALQDPLRGLTMLGRQGVTFTAQEKEKIKTLAESNRLLDAQQIIMASVERQVGGTAAATATSTSKMSVAFGEVQESLGFALLPTVEAVADAMTTHVIPALQSFADAAKNNGGPALAQAFKDALPTILDLGKAALDIALTIKDSMIPVFGIAMQLLRSIAPLVTGFADALKNVPGPIIAIGAALLILRTRMTQTLITTMATARTSVATAFASMRTSAITFSNTLKVEMIKAKTQMGAMVAAARVMSLGVVGAFRAIGVAAKGLLTSMGPVGWALIGLSVAFEVFSTNSAIAKQKAMEYKDALDQLTGAANSASTELLVFNLMSKEVGGFVGIGTIAVKDLANQTGLSMAEISAGVQGTQVQFDALIESVLNAAKAGQLSSSETRMFVDVLEEERAAVATARTEIETRNAAMSEATTITGNAARAEGELGVELMTAGRAMQMNGAELQTLGEVTSTTEAAVRALKDSFSELNAVIDKSDAQDRMTESLREMQKSFKDNEASAMDNRDAIRNYMKDAISFAETLKDPREQLKVMEGALKDVEKQLTAEGVNPKTSKLYKDMKGAVDAAKDEVKNMGDAVTEAKDAGLDVADAIAQGITQGMSEQEAALNAAGLAGGETVIDGLMDGAGVNSPSIYGMQAGRDIALGAIQGLNQMKSASSGAGMNIGANIVRGMITALNNGRGPVASAARAIVAAAIAAARAESQEGSPSRVFMTIGDNMIRGLEIGVVSATTRAAGTASQAARAFMRAFSAEFFPKDMGQAESAIANAIASADMKLKDAKEAVKQANKDLREAEKALNKARRENIDAAKEQEKAERKLAKAQEELKNASGDDERKAAKQRVKQAEEDLANARRDANRTARDLAAAEGALARARREATEAADAAKLAAWVEANRKALDELQKIAATFDRIKEKTAVAQEGFAALGELVATPFGQPTEISEMFGSGANIDTVINGFFKIRDSVKQAYAVLTDASIVGEKAAKRNRAAMNATIKELENLTAQAVQLREQHAAVMQEMKTLEEDYQKDVAETNAFYDAAEKKAEENIKAIEDRWAAAIPVLQEALKSANDAYEKENATLKKLIDDRDQFVGSIKSGFRSFVNSLSFESRAATKQIVKETKRLADGVTVTLERELEVGGGPAAIRETLQERLDAVREFSRNIRTLMERGLDPTLVRDFVSAGVDGAGVAAAALASGSQDDIAAINTVQSQLLSEAEDFGAYASAQWHDIGIAQQQAIVAPLEVARDAAQKALDDANTLRDQELAAARAHLDKLKADRAAALATLESEYNAKKADLEARATALQAQMDAVAAQIEAKIQEMVTKTATASAQAGQDAAQKLLDGFKKKYPGLYKEMNGLMTQLANSMNRTATIFVQTVYSAVNPVTPPPGAKVPKRALGGPVSARTAYLVGERGPELFVPGFAGNIIPNNQMGTVPAMGSRSSGGGAAVININVNAGMGANGDEIGRVIVDSLRKYERRNGPIPVKVSG